MVHIMDSIPVVMITLLDIIPLLIPRVRMATIMEFISVQKIHQPHLDDTTLYQTILYAEARQRIY